MGFTERPPILRGSAEQQLAALRDYLFRLAGSLDTAANAPAAGAGYIVRTGADGSSVYAPGGGADAASEKAAIERMRKNARELRALILKTADTIVQEMDTREEEYKGYFLAQSEFGEFEDTLDNRITTSALGVLEEYRLLSRVTTLENSQQYLTEISGEIRRGFLEDPSTGETVIGIAISQKLSFTENKQTIEGFEYHEIADHQTFGMYTSTGWQFWIDGSKAGWFDSEDGMLHVANIYVEDALTFSGNWRVRSTGAAGDELEIMYMG